MIVASRIPALTERMRAATIRAAQEGRGPAGMTEAARAPERGPGEGLDRLGAKAALAYAA